MCWPRISNAARAGGEAFKWALYWRNREYNALLGFLGAVAVLAWKVWG